ncbi:LysR family transcriptional regulator [Francisella adeliensis]|uniref:LysR family transcriptional regulator n=1 Tax=Francisella adeliensis TaxID=2007306 RepID=A0A2Z4XZH6_9GAMM|nr:LysR family transcriptional regulator [Francisella adeliensis]AXA34076.1 LysR family transcriptional regulator [Francisella adeliensis]MBK2085241.1 LysR family transcriptional regulator [Francisella adeliensis]MBK2095991.1 LysR family transcriptional regulator [Francisella adeliensis]QIW12316.1 LysR family transcriptional regulator [Francisella adeliensis]QIW14190.1 LysR family transcriptional regulator [Francisella adeliensis]
MIKRNDLPPLNSLPVFIAVMRTKSYTKAAEKLFMTHSAVSQSIKKLECFLDIKLFLTSKKRLETTQAAEKYYAKIEPLMTEIYNSTNVLKECQSKKITINCMTTLCANWLIPKLDSVMEALEDTDIQLTTLGKHVDFDNDDVDISIEYGFKEEFEGLNKYKLAEGELILVCNNKNIGKSCLEIISQQKLIYVDDRIRIDDFNYWCQHNGINVKSNKKIVFKSSLQAIKACFSGIGFFVTDKLLIEEHIKNGFLYIPEQKSYLTGKSYYLLSKNDQPHLFQKIKKLLVSFLNEKTIM